MATEATTQRNLVTYNIDPAHSRVGFTARHMGFSKVRGRFESFEGTVRMEPDDLETLEAVFETPFISTARDTTYEFIYVSTAGDTLFAAKAQGPVELEDTPSFSAEVGSLMSKAGFGDEKTRIQQRN